MAPHPRCAKSPVSRLHPRRFTALRPLRRRADPALAAFQPRGTPPADAPRDWAPAAFPLFRAGTLLAAVLLASLALWAPSPVPDAPDAGTPLPEAPAAGVTTDGSSEAWAGIPVPPKPGPGQETRCEPDNAEVSINGACYVETKASPPCPGKQYEHGGKCWVAVGKRERPAQSLGR
jgi:hypothetical protein